MGSSNSLTNEDMSFGELSRLLKGLLMLPCSVTLFLRVRVKWSCQADEDEAKKVKKAKDEVELKELNNTNWLSRRSIKSHVKRIASAK